jgi:hypothetical protein
MWGRVRREPRLDPVRWSRPSRSALLRLVAVTALLATAAALLWYRPHSCVAADCLAAPGEPARSSGVPGDLGPARAGRPASSTPGPPPGPTSGGPTGLPSGGPAGLSPEGPGGFPAGTAVPGRLRSAVPVGMVGVPVRPAEPTALRLIRPGDRVDLFRIADRPQPIATAALVLEVTGADDPTTGGLLLALTPAQAQGTVARPDHGYAVLLRPPG